MILFLDFDGVLHPVPGKHLLCHLPRLEGVLRKFPDVQVVISSFWRATHELWMLKEYFSEDIQPRIIDVTPFTDVKDEYGFLAASVRYDEILKWIEKNNYKGPWVALDDAYQEFPNPCSQLVVCHTIFGFDDNAEFRLVNYLVNYNK